MSKAIINTFKKLDTDTSQNKQDNSSFYDAQNLRLISDEPLSNGALVNYKGTKAKVQVGERSVLVKGYAEVGNDLVLLLYNETTLASSIAKVRLTESDALQIINGFNYQLEIRDFNPDKSSFYLDSGVYDLASLYSDIDSVNKLGFNTVNAIETIGRYENSLSKKIYFAVPDYPLRTFNIESTTEELRYDASNLDIIPNNIGSVITINSLIPGGKLESGKIQYACKLFNKYGAETTFSSCSELISLTSSNYNGSTEFKGSDLEVNSGKSVNINISIPTDNQFSYIHIYSIHYKVKDTPVISLVGELQIPSNSFSFVDSGTILDSVTLEEFNIFGGKLISAETIGTKNNILFAANTKEISDIIELDCRAYRYAPGNINYPTLTLTLTSNTIDDFHIDFTHNGVTRTAELQLAVEDPTGATINDTAFNIATYFHTNGDDAYCGFEVVYVGPASILFIFNKNEVGVAPVNTISIGNYSTFMTSTIVSQSGNFINDSYIYESDDVTNPSYYKITSTGSWKKYVYDYTTSAYVEFSSGTDFSIPTTADCINRYNNEFEKANETVTTSYNYDRNTLDAYGGTGRVVSYEIKVGDPKKLMDNGETIVDSSNINFILKETSFKQGETYRVGVVPYDLKGKPYFTEWVGDIRIPYFTGDQNLLSTTGYLDDTATWINIDCMSRNAYIEFTINTANILPATLDKISGFEIVKVQRNVNDRSVVAQGCSIGGVAFYEQVAKNRCFPNTFGDPITSEDVSTAVNKIHTFYSPEFNINGGIDISGDYKLRIVKILKTPLVQNLYTNAVTPVYKFYYAVTGVKCVSSIFYPINSISDDGTVSSSELTGVKLFDVAPGYSFDVSNIYKTNIVDLNGQTFLLANERYTNRTISNTDVTQTMYGQTGIIMDSSTSLPIMAEQLDSNVTGYTYILDLYVDNATSRYGGNTYTARILNEYEKCSAFITKDLLVAGSKINAYGDTYNTIWDTITSGADPSIDDGTENLYGANADRRQVISLLPLESSINCMLTGSKPSKYAYRYPSGKDINSAYIGLAETQVKGISIWGDRYPNVGDFNAYNTVYSSTSKYPTFFVKPTLFDNLKEELNTIYASEKKVNGEYIDNWSKFLYANSLEVEGIYGAIHKLTTLDNKLYFFQEGAIGVAAVNDRYIIGAGDAAKLSLGTGQVLERYDYVKYNEGIIKPEHVINTITNLYFIDHNRRVIDIVGNSDVALSIDKGVNSLFRSLYKDRTTLVAIGFDPVHREVFFNINNGIVNKTLVYNENINQFGPRTSATPSIFLNIANGLLSFKQSNNVTGISNYIYKHNAGNIGELYSEGYAVIVGEDIEHNPTYSISTEPVYILSYVSILVGSGTAGVFVADNVEFRTEVRPYNEDSSIFSDKATFSPIINSSLESGVYGDVLKTVNSIEFKNSYQSVLKTIIVKTDNNDGPFIESTYPNTSRRHRSWTTQVPFSKDVTTGNNVRFLDTFLSMKLSFTNTGNKVFKLHDIITYIRPTHK